MYQKACNIYYLFDKPYIDDVKVSQVALTVNNPPANAGYVRDTGLIPLSRRSPRGENGNPLYNSCLENPMDRGAWWATVHGIAESDMIEAT